MIKEVEDFNPFNYHGYFLVETDKDITVKFFTSNGYTIFDDYDVYKFDGFSLLAFYDVQENLWIKDFQITYEEQSLLYQNEFYEKFKEILNGESQEVNDIYIFMNSVEIQQPQSFHIAGISAEERCDFNKFGPNIFYPRISQESMKVLDFKLLTSVTGAGHIIWVKIESVNDTYGNQNIAENRQIYTTARTLSGSLKLINEWSQMVDEPWNNTEQISLKAKDFLQLLNIDKEDLEETFAPQCDMRIVRFLKNDHEFKSLPESKFISEGLKKYFSKYYKYLSLKSIAQNHPKGSLLTEDILDKETSIYQELISYYCLMNGIDQLSTTLQEVHAHAGEKPHYKDEYAYREYNNLITDVIEKMLGDEFSN
jgi:hypothetical protein